MFKNWGFFVKLVRDTKSGPPDGSVNYRRQAQPRVWFPSGYITVQPIDLESLIKQIEKSAVTVIVVYFTASTLRGTILAFVRARANPF